MIEHVLFVLVVVLSGIVAILLPLFICERDERKIWEKWDDINRGQIAALTQEVAELKRQQYRLRAVLDGEEEDDE